MKALKPGRYMLLTHGEGYSLDNGQAIRRKTAERLIGDLFNPTPQKPSIMQANDDGLFPGHSQTWSVVS